MPRATSVPPELPLQKTLHDLAGSLTVLSLNLPELQDSSHHEAFTACQTAIEQARRTLKSAWRDFDEFRIEE